MKHDSWQQLGEAALSASVLVIWFYDLTEARSLFLVSVPYADKFQSTSTTLQIIFLFVGPLFALFPFMLNQNVLDALNAPNGLLQPPKNAPPNADVTLPYVTKFIFVCY